MKIDIFTHVMLPRYKRALYKYADKFPTEKAVQDKRPSLTDMELRMRILEHHADLVQVLSTTMPPIEEIAGPAEAAELARICNDEMAEVVARYPDRHIAAIANVPLNNIDMALRETERAIEELGFKGIQIYTRVNGKPPSTDEMIPLYELMVKHDLPIWLHPMRGSNQPDYNTEDVSYNQLFSIFGWPYDTTAAMLRLVFAGIFEKFPSIKFITHHLGGMVPYFSDRIVVHYNNGLQRLGVDKFPGLTKHPIEYLKMFYADTALDGNSNYALECGLAFFGEDHVLFGTDMPYDVENGGVSLRETINGIERMNLSDSTKKKIYEENARRLLHL
ncbi:MAG: amidohydrolase family protein [Peptococcaceae bacterium]|jgi:aminocarboxymuconate-semialdehyde decarboxylase|nr:amidohydrolase family protein [Peptococcaceae bacterium]